MQNIETSTLCIKTTALHKMFFFNPRVLLFFLFIHEIYVVGTHLKSLTKYPQHMFSWWNMNNIYLLNTLIYTHVKIWHLISRKHWLTSRKSQLPVRKMTRSCYLVINLVKFIPVLHKKTYELIRSTSQRIFLWVSMTCCYGEIRKKFRSYHHISYTPP